MNVTFDDAMHGVFDEEEPVQAGAVDDGGYGDQGGYGIANLDGYESQGGHGHGMLFDLGKGFAGRNVENAMRANARTAAGMAREEPWQSGLRYRSRNR